MDAAPASTVAPAPVSPPGGRLAQPARSRAAGVRHGKPAIGRCAPETLHPALWLGHQLGRTGAQAVATGFATLDAELPGGGWPRRVLSDSRQRTGTLTGTAGRMS